MKAFLLITILIAGSMALSPQACLKDIKEIVSETSSLIKDIEAKDVSKIITDVKTLATDAQQTIQDCNPKGFNSISPKKCFEDIKTVVPELKKLVQDIENKDFKSLIQDAEADLPSFKQILSDCTKKVEEKSEGTCQEDIKALIPDVENFLKREVADWSRFIPEVLDIIPTAKAVIHDCKKADNFQISANCSQDLKDLVPKVVKITKDLAGDAIPFITNVKDIVIDLKSIFKDCKKTVLTEETSQCVSDIDELLKDFGQLEPQFTLWSLATIKDLEAIVPTFSAVTKDCKKTSGTNGIADCIKDIEKLIPEVLELGKDEIADVPTLLIDLKNVISQSVTTIKDCLIHPKKFLW